MNRFRKEIRATGLIGSATLLSRIIGFVRDMVLAYFLGSGFSADCFLVAFRIPNFLRSLFAEGALTVSFLPVYTEYLTTRPKKESYDLAFTLFVALGLALALLVLAGTLLGPRFISIIAPGFFTDPEKLRLTVQLHRIMFPYILLISMAALAGGILNSQRHFLAPALTPGILNLSIVIASVFAYFFGKPAKVMAIGVLTGGFLQMLFQLPFLSQTGFFMGRPNLDLKHPGLKKILRLMGPAAMGAAIYQIGVLMNTFLASFLPEGSISYLYYADRLLKFPLGLFAISLGTAIFPTLSAHAAKLDLEAFKNTLTSSMAITIFISLPAATGLIILGKPIITLLFERGRFDPASTEATYQALFFYSLGLVPVSINQVLVRSFYARQEITTAVKVGFFSLLVNLAFCLLFMGPLHHAGLALATSLSSLFQMGVLMILTKRRIRDLDLSGLASSLMKSLGSCIGMAAVLFAFERLMLVADITSLMFRVGAGVASGLCAYLILSKFLGSDELELLELPILSRNNGLSGRHK